MRLTERHEQWLAKIQPRPRTSYVSQGRAVLATDREGQIVDDPRHGFFVHETRLLSCYRYFVNGGPTRMVACSNVEQHSWLGYFAVTPPGLKWRRDTGSGAVQPVSQQTIELKVSRTVGYGVHEDIDITDFTQEASSFDFAVEVGADFADQSETDEREQEGKLKTRWERTGRSCWELTYDYRAEHRYSHQGNRGKAEIHRRLIFRIENCGSKPSFKDGRIRFQVKLGPRQSWHTCIKLIPEIDGEKLPVLYKCRDFFADHTKLDRARAIFLTEATGFSTPQSATLSDAVTTSLEQAKEDLSALRLHDMDRGERAWVMAAGLPIYIALFGRDTLTTSWMSAMLSPDMMKGTLAELAEWQGRVINDWRDEQPGRMLHEAHTGPLAMLGFNPRTRYYGANTTSSFYAVVVAELWHWTGDKSLVKPLIKPALDGLRWKDKYADLRGDGYSYYKTRSEQGNKNQGWKDSGDAIVYEDGSQVETPIATCEEQAFVYGAKLHLSEVLWFMGERELAHKLFHEAQELKQRFNEDFWVDELKFFALGIDPKGNPIRTVASNPGHCLAAGIVDHDYVLPTARRMMAAELFTGWGIRTLSSEHPAFDPYSYHRGTVWPVEHGSFAIGFMRYGLHREQHRMARAIFEATTLFPYNRLPECFSGHQRTREQPFPALYPKANWPQAWSAAALFTIVQAMLGIFPFAPMHVLFVDPQLPAWLPEITLHNLRVGNARVTIRFYRRGERSHYDVLDKRGKLHIIRQPSPWSLTANFAERVADVISSMI
jgi:glycogen debranching enzyme